MTGWHHALDPFDDRIETLADRFRGRRLYDLAFGAASAVGDHGMVWVLVAAWQARLPGARRARAIRALALAGFTSLAVNAALKQMAGRERPERRGPTVASSPLPLRTPSTSSFPSGHTLAAWCAATALAEDTWSGALLCGTAAIIGASRVHLQAHHASDVVAGAVVGTAIGVLVRRVLRTPSGNGRDGMGAWARALEGM